MKRRLVERTLLAGVVLCAASGFGAGLDAAVEQANAVLWRDFVSPHGILYDYVGELPTPEDCAKGRPNALGWWSPIENGPMFTGPYLKAMVLRAQRTGAAEDREKCRKLAEGLLLCASVSDVPGMVCRGVIRGAVCQEGSGTTAESERMRSSPFRHTFSAEPGDVQEARDKPHMRAEIQDGMLLPNLMIL